MAKKPPAPKYKAVMLIDDNHLDNFINQKMIEGCNFSSSIYVHTSSKSALEFLNNLVRMGSSGKIIFPAFIFLDINMPIMDGYQFINEFEKIPDEFKNKTKIAFLTTSLNPDDTIKARKISYVVEFINKPLTHKILSTL
jgi:CheY-like chemotaxis protein